MSLAKTAYDALCDYVVELDDAGEEHLAEELRDVLDVIWKRLSAEDLESMSVGEATGRAAEHIARRGEDEDE